VAVGGAGDHLTADGAELLHPLAERDDLRRADERAATQQGLPSHIMKLVIYPLCKILNPIFIFKFILQYSKAMLCNLCKKRYSLANN